MHGKKWGALAFGVWLAALVPVHAQAFPAPLAQPALVKADTLNSADTAWMMTATALALLMTLPGIALFYGGVVRKKSVLNVRACVVATCAIVSLLWFRRYSIVFTPGTGALNPFLGGTERPWFAGLDCIRDAQQVADSPSPSMPSASEPDQPNSYSQGAPHHACQ